MKDAKLNYSSMTDPIAFAVAFLGNLETKFFKYLSEVFGILFFQNLVFYQQIFQKQFEHFSTTDLRDEQ